MTVSELVQAWFPASNGRSFWDRCSVPWRIRRPGKVYFFPSDAERVCCVDTETDEVKLVGPIFLEGMNKWQRLGDGRRCIQPVEATGQATEGQKIAAYTSKVVLGACMTINPNVFHTMAEIS